MTESKDNFAFEFAQHSMEQFLQPEKPPHCYICKSIDLIPYYAGLNSLRTCKKCLDFMSQEIKHVF